MSRANPSVKIHGERVEMRPLAKIIPYEKNARQHSKAQLDALAAQIQSAGFTSPLVVDEDGIILGGHGRLAAAKQIGLPALPCVVVRGLSEKKKRALRVADNSIALAATWDEALLSGELSALRGLGEDLISLGFDPLELGRLGVEGFDLPTRLEAAEETPPLPKKPVVSKGELWLLGDHRLLCGDSTSAADVERLLDGAKPNLMITDPPYGVEYDPEWRGEARNGDGSRLSTGAGRAKGLVSNDNRDDWRDAWVLFQGDVLYVWHAVLRARQVMESVEASGFVIRTQIIWAKSHFAVGRGDYHVQHEPCLYAVRKGKAGHWSSDRKQTTLWAIDKPQKSETGHSTQKPIECMRRPILNNSKPGDAIYEPFSGSFTTGIACEMEKRRCYAIEIDPAYVQLSVERWEKYSGKTAVRDDGATLEDLKDGKTAKKVLRAIKTGKTKLVKAKP